MLPFFFWILPFLCMQIVPTGQLLRSKKCIKKDIAKGCAKLKEIRFARYFHCVLYQMQYSRRFQKFTKNSFKELHRWINVLFKKAESHLAIDHNSLFSYGKLKIAVLILKIYCWNFFGFFKNVSDISDHQFKFMLCFAPLLCLLIMNYHEMFLRRLEWWLTQPSEDWRLYNNTSWWCVENPTYNVLSQLSSGTLTLFLLFTQFMLNDSAQKLNNLKRIVHSHFITEQVDFYS